MSIDNICQVLRISFTSDGLRDIPWIWARRWSLKHLNTSYLPTHILLNKTHGNGMDSRVYDKTTRRVPKIKRQATSEDFKTHIINDSTSEFEHQNNLQCTKCVRDFKMLKLGNNYTGEKRRCRQHVEESCFVLSG